MPMNGTIPPETEGALMVWVNSFSLSSRVDSLGEMNDGQAIWEMLREINAENFTGKLPNRTQSDYSRNLNLQYINKQMLSYLDGKSSSFTGFTDHDLKIMAMNESSSSIAKARSGVSPTPAFMANCTLQFLKVVSLVMIKAPNPAVFEKLQALPVPTQVAVATLMEEMSPGLISSEHLDSSSSADGQESQGTFDVDSDRAHSISGPDSLSRPKMDRILEVEEQYAILKSQLERKDNECQDLMAERDEISDSFVRMEESYDAVKKQLKDRDTEVRRLSSMHNERELSSVKDLESKISQQEEMIARQESQITEYQSNEAEQKRKVYKLVDADDKLQKLQDDFNIQKRELEQQTKKANTVDKYKQKVQASQNAEKERESLRQELEEARSRVMATDKLRRENAQLRQEHDEMSQTLQRSEQEHNELRLMKKEAFAEMKRLNRDLKAMHEKSAQDQERMADLEDRFGGSETHSSPTVVDGGLESELAESSKHEQQMQVASNLLLWVRVIMSDRKTRILELEKRIRQLTDDASNGGTKVAILQRQLDNAQDLSADQCKQFQVFRQEISQLQTSILEVRQGHPIEGTETFRRMREQLKAAQKKCVELEDKLAVAENKVEAANRDRALVDKPKVQMIEEVKKQHSAALIQLQSEHSGLQKRYDALQGEFDKQTEERNQAWSESHEAVVAKAEHETTTAADGQALRELTAIIQQASAGNSAVLSKNNDELFHQHIDAFAQKIEQGRERLAKGQQQIEKQSAIIKDLESRVQAQPIIKEPAASVQATVDDVEGSKIKPELSFEERSYTQNLERELKLMSSAYHDLAGRLQMNNVVLQRRAEAPKSWLGRQRKTMEGVGGLVR